MSCSTIWDFLKAASQLFGGYFCWLLGTIHIYSVRRTDSIKINIFWKCIWALRTMAKYIDKVKYAIDQLFCDEEDTQHCIPCVQIVDLVLWDFLLSCGALALCSSALHSTFGESYSGSTEWETISNWQWSVGVMVLFVPSRCHLHPQKSEIQAPSKTAPRWGRDFTIHFPLASLLEKEMNGWMLPNI